MQITISPISILSDNYVWIIENAVTKDAYVVDPGVAAPPLAHIAAKGLTVRGVLITHSHWDHIGELDTFLSQIPSCPVYGPVSPKIPEITHPLLVNAAKEDSFALFNGGLRVDAWRVPGHLREHIAYRVDIDNVTRVFSGDILFSAGCGRHFEGEMHELYESVHSINALDESTLVYGSHEYTLANLRFAKHVEPNNKNIDIAYNLGEQKRAADCPTLPTPLSLERKINPFLRLHSKQIQQRVQNHFNIQVSTPSETFSALRQWKNNF